MAEFKKSFILYCDSQSTINKLSNEQAGKLFKHLFAYVNGDNPGIPDDLVVEIAAEPIIQQLKRDLITWRNKLNGRSNAGQLGNLKRWHNDLYKQIIADEIQIEEALTIAKSRKVSQKVTKVAVNVTVNDSVNVIETKNNIEGKIASFKNDLQPHLLEFGKDILNAFFLYWTEKSPRGRKMRFEKQKVFDISRRLATWKKNEGKFGTKKTYSETVLGDEKHAEVIAAMNFTNDEKICKNEEVKRIR